MQGSESNAGADLVCDVPLRYTWMRARLSV